MFRLQLIVLIGLALTLSARAGGARAASGPLPAGPLAASSLPHVRQRLKQDRVEVRRLQQDVARQESDSQRASRRLQQQDQTIDELLRQLRELQARPVADDHGKESPR
jgi:septal ring factor EnvC (AmiA/AmiB activator)